MTCCVNSVSWECCYPDPCDCCSGCISCACCNSNNCSNPCNSSSTCGQGGCCTCDSNSWGYAWKQSCSMCPSSICPNCGDLLFFKPTGDCGTWWAGQRFDTHNEGASTPCDLTKALFTQFAPLNQGIISNMRISNDSSDCCA